MDRRVVVEAPAKVNLHLQVLDRRPDGFHDILSLFQAVSLRDTLDVRILPDPGIRVFGEFDCSEPENTIARAARVFLDALDRREGIEVHAVKRIPAGAGLGGGSSDAAAVLKALNRAFGNALSGTELARLAAEIGSDVPFFLGGPCAVVSGRGEIVEPSPARSDYSLVVLFPGFQTRTAAAYAAVDLARRGSPPAGTGGMDARRIRKEYRKGPETWTFRNDFYDALAPVNPELGRVRDALDGEGSAFSGMTGSGSAFFGVFGSEAAAERAAGTLNEREGGQGRWIAAVAAPLARMPVPRLQ